MTGTKAGVANNSWHAALKQCARVYNEGKQTDAKPTGTKSECACKDKPKAEKKREVDREIKKERAATKARHAQSTKDLKADDARVKKAIRKTEEPAKKAHREKLREAADKSKKDMRDQSDARALAKVQARRRLTTKTAA